MRVARHAQHARCALQLRLLASQAAAAPPPHPPPTWLELCSGLPVIAGRTEAAGRGLFALRDLKAGTVVCAAPPVVAHPPHGCDDVCHSCLRSLPASPVRCAGKLLCSSACAADAERRYLSAQAAARLDGFEADCAQRGVLHPMLAARLACGVTQGTAHPAALEPLCFARGAVESPPPHWVAEHTTLREAFERANLPCAFLTLPWYVSVLARLHVNAFRVDIPRTDIKDLSALARVAEHGNGTAAYMLPSLANHECDPALDAVWRHGDATLTLTTRRDVAAGEECRITYIDASVPVEQRRRELRFAYGFVCGCVACTEEAADTAGGGGVVW